MPSSYYDLVLSAMLHNLCMDNFHVHQALRYRPGGNHGIVTMVYQCSTVH